MEQFETPRRGPQGVFAWNEEMGQLMEAIPNLKNFNFAWAVGGRCHLVVNQACCRRRSIIWKFLSMAEQST
jgi:hypothetical protein